MSNLNALSNHPANNTSSDPSKLESSTTLLSICPSNSYMIYTPPMGTAVAQWLRCCATDQKVAGLIPDGVIGIFH